MKTALKQFALILSLVAVSSSNASEKKGGGSHVGGGGDLVAAEFISYGHRVALELEKLPEAERLGISTVKLKLAIDSTSVETVDGVIIHEGKKVDAVNYPALSKIFLSRPSWAAFTAPPTRKRFALHEYLGIMMMDDANYQISGRLFFDDVPAVPELAGDFALAMKNFSEGAPAHSPWAGWWWSYTGGGIDNGKYGGDKSPLKRYAQARGLPYEEMAAWEKAHHGTGLKDVQGWHGHSYGWSAISTLIPEPRSEKRVNGVLFSVGDIKALFTEIGMAVEGATIGKPVHPWDWSGKDDTTPNDFFRVLTDVVGRQKKGVVIDRFTTTEMWEQPLAGYRLAVPKPVDYLGEHDDIPGVYRIKMTARIWWMSDNVQPSYLTEPFRFEENFGVDSREIRFELWLDGPVEFDAEKKIVRSGNLLTSERSGKWLQEVTSDEHPDFMVITEHINPKSTKYNHFIDPAWVIENFAGPEYLHLLKE